MVPAATGEVKPEKFAASMRLSLDSQRSERCRCCCSTRFEGVDRRAVVRNLGKIMIQRSRPLEIQGQLVCECRVHAGSEKRCRTGATRRCPGGLRLCLTRPTAVHLPWIVIPAFLPQRPLTLPNPGDIPRIEQTDGNSNRANQPLEPPSHV